jgi:hypothetical protein
MITHNEKSEIKEADMPQAISRFMFFPYPKLVFCCQQLLSML